MSDVAGEKMRDGRNDEGWRHAENTLKNPSRYERGDLCCANPPASIKQDGASIDFESSSYGECSSRDIAQAIQMGQGMLNRESRRCNEKSSKLPSR